MDPSETPTQVDGYLELIRAFPLRPLRTGDDLDRAVAVIDSLINRDELSPGEDDYLRVPASLVEAYEDEHDPLPEDSEEPGVENLRFLTAENHLTLVRLHDETGVAVSTLSEILSGKRGISRSVREKLAARFCTPPSLFV